MKMVEGNKYVTASFVSSAVEDIRTILQKLAGHDQPDNGGPMH
jgi:hypothetical protein